LGLTRVFLAANVERQRSSVLAVLDSEGWDLSRDAESWWFATPGRSFGAADAPGRFENPHRELGFAHALDRSVRSLGRADTPAIAVWIRDSDFAYITASAPAVEAVVVETVPSYEDDHWMSVTAHVIRENGASNWQSSAAVRLAHWALEAGLNRVEPQQLATILQRRTHHAEAEVNAIFDLFGLPSA
jgi:hypothetical protein